MSAEIINLRRVRKLRTRAAKEAAATENRAKFGRSRHERSIATAAENVERRKHEGHQLVPTAGDGVDDAQS